MATPDDQAAALRRAVESADFARAEDCARRYSSAVRTSLTGLSAADAESHLRDACQLLEWARRGLCAARARLRGEFGQVLTAAGYCRAEPHVIHTWKIDG